MLIKLLSIISGVADIANKTPEATYLCLLFEVEALVFKVVSVFFGLGFDRGTEVDTVLLCHKQKYDL